MAIGTDELTFRVTGEQTDGALLAVDVRLPAGGGPPVLHRHAPLEVYRVDRGELAIYLEEADGAVQRIAAGPGAVVHIPAGRAHTVRNESDARGDRARRVRARARRSSASCAPRERSRDDRRRLRPCSPSPSATGSR